VFLNGTVSQAFNPLAESRTCQPAPKFMMLNKNDSDPESNVQKFVVQMPEKGAPF